MGRVYYFNDQAIAAPLTIRSNEPVFQSDSLGLRREAYTQGAQRWEIDMEVGPDSNQANYLVDSVTQFQKGYTNYTGSEFIMPQLHEHHRYLDNNTLTVVTTGNGVNDSFDSSALSVSEGATAVAVTGMPSDYDLTGAFFSFTENGAPGSDKVYLITSHTSTNINFYPAALREVRSGATVNLKNVPFYYTYDDSTLRGMKYSDGILGQPDTVKIIEDLTIDNRVPLMRFTATPGTITEGDKAVFTAVSRGISDVRPVNYSTTSNGLNADANTERYSGTINLVSDGETTFSFDTTTDGILEGNTLEYSVAGIEEVTATFVLADTNAQVAETTFNLTDETVKTYALTSDKTQVNEGETITFTLTMRNATENETVPFTISPADAGNDLGLGAGYTGGNFVFTSNQAKKNVATFPIAIPKNADTYSSQTILSAYGDDRWVQTYVGVTPPDGSAHTRYTYNIPTTFTVETTGAYTLADITGRIRGDRYPNPIRVYGRIVNDPDHCYVKDPQFVITTDPTSAAAAVFTTTLTPDQFVSNDKTTVNYTLTGGTINLVAGTTYHIVQSYSVGREEDSAFQNHFYVNDIAITPQVGLEAFTLTVTPDTTQSITFSIVEVP